jgi:hypothetical protein
MTGRLETAGTIYAVSCFPGKYFWIIAFVILEVGVYKQSVLLEFVDLFTFLHVTLYIQL